ncbi:MAG TPA: DUF881 domain-containing protein [Candidatus Limnocylindrales bacterium]|nr:DUF881 domain-containing protein [Candidatus Limnocylindrales bacterium]
MLSRSVDRTARAQRIFAVSLIALVLGFLMVVQIRSQARVDESLANQDNTSIALLINDLNRGNSDLLQQTVTLGQRQEALRQALASGGSDTAALNHEVTVLGVVSGTVPVHGPGLEIRIQGSVQDFELQDALNDLRNAGAEAFSLNGYRLIASTPIALKDGALTVDDHRISSPYVLRVIGDPERLQTAADISASSLQTRVQVSIDRKTDLAITEVLTPRPLIYAQLGS